MKYSVKPENPSKCIQANGSYLRVHFKNTRETAAPLRNLTLRKAREYLENVIRHKDIVPFRRFCGGVGRKSMAKQRGASQGRWPEKSCKILLSLIKNLENSAECKSLNTDNLIVTHVQVNPAPTLRRRTYRAHGRINAYLSHPCHVQMICTEQDSTVPKATTGGIVSSGVGKKRRTVKRLK